ncbi:halocin C8-like domain-containing protein [Methanosarcina sp. Z-7115]|uniref:Halocin C8-like domain-containing protein n=1 Tax=Methanosarcina baikalica TaxID=3073890 RepID=A0ABU2D309_9EURY|nr:halocin C8-like domain-containing protein [Methanosarcina sp. Z-7115]MDR7666369.1 halocin C8-like domain-containing protein [Methanosarcina sp. Z-7115]
MIILVIGMILVTPVLACPAGTKTQISVNCPNCSNGLKYITTIAKLDSNEINNYLPVVSKDARVEKLTKELTSRGYKLNTKDTTGMNVTLANDSLLPGVIKELIIPFTSTDNSQVGILAGIKDNKIIKVQAIITHRDEDLFPTSVDALTVKGNNIETETVTTDSVLGVGAKDRINSAFTIASTSPLGNVIKATTSSVTCSGCMALWDWACAIGCGVGMYGLCLAAGLASGIGGLACVVVASAVCYGVGQWGCGMDDYTSCVLLGYC